MISDGRTGRRRRWGGCWARPLTLDLEIPGNLFFDCDFSPFNFLAPISQISENSKSMNLHALSFGAAAADDGGGGPGVSKDSVGRSGGGAGDVCGCAGGGEQHPILHLRLVPLPPLGYSLARMRIKLLGLGRSRPTLGKRSLVIF